MGRKKSAKRKPKKDPVKQRAGRLGAKARWTNMLNWHRQVERMRGGTFGKHKLDVDVPKWKLDLINTLLNLKNVALRYVLLWRANGCPKGSVPGASWAQLAKLEGWPREAREEFFSLADRCYVNRRDAVGVARTAGRKFPMLYAKWSYRGLEGCVQITPAEKEKMELRKPPQPPSRTLVRQAAVLQAYKYLRVRFGKASIRAVQRRIKERKDIDASYEIIRRDLQAMGCE